MAARAVRVTRYPSGLRQSAHTHEAPHLSLVLAGGFFEQTGRREISFHAARLAVRPAGLRHAGAFGPQGALILTAAFPAHATFIRAPSWSNALPRERLRSLLPSLLAEDYEAVEAAWDLLALAQSPPPRSPSAWISAVRDQLIEEPAQANLSAMARRHGRHRVHLGRAFLAAFGETPSAFRRRAMLDRALCRIVGGQTPAIAALDAGFADQSHLTRACRDVFGVAPGRLTRRAVDVASVQYAPR